MKYNNEVINGKANIFINSNIYKLETIMKTAYVFIDRIYIYLDYVDNDYILIQLKSKKLCSEEYLEDIIGEFLNELLHQNLRLNVYNETKNLREMILARALFDQCVDTSEVTDNITDIDDEDECIDDINKNWFDSNNNGD